MHRRKLKNYKEYLRRVTLFAEAMNIKIEYVDDLEVEGIWTPHYRKILVCTEMSHAENIAAILHEIGHSMDDMFSTSFTVGSKMDRAYKAFYKGKYTKKQKALVVACEKKAWSNARDIAKRLKIPLGSWFDRLEKELVHTYIKDESNENT